MKTVMLLLFELFFVVMAQSQHLVIAPTIEKTVAGYQYGTQLLYETKRQWSLGGFYQTSFQKGIEGYQPLNPFFGMAVNAPIVKSDRITFFFNIRGGLINQHFLVVSPAVETRLRITNFICLSTGMSVRMTYPSAFARIIFKI